MCAVLRVTTVTCGFLGFFVFHPASAVYFKTIPHTVRQLDEQIPFEYLPKNLHPVSRHENFCHPALRLRFYSYSASRQTYRFRTFRGYGARNYKKYCKGRSNDVRGVNTIFRPANTSLFQVSHFVMAARMKAILKKKIPVPVPLIL